jgi:hypothetical protein
MKIMTFIGCYGHRRNATPWGSRVTKVSFETYEEANDWVEGQMCDDDDGRVWFFFENDAYHVWFRDKETGRLVVTKNSMLFADRYLSDFV